MRLGKAQLAAESAAGAVGADGGAWSGEVLKREKLEVTSGPARGPARAREAAQAGEGAGGFLGLSARARTLAALLLLPMLYGIYAVTTPLRWKFVPELRQTKLDDRGALQTVREDVKDEVTAQILTQKSAAEGARDADVPTIEDVIEKVEGTPEDQAAVLNAEADFEAHAEESGDVVESDTAEATAEDAAAPDAPSTDVHPDASEQAKLDTPSVVTVVDPEPEDMVAPGEEHAQAVGATVAEGTHDEAADEPEATEELEEAEGVAEAQGVSAEKVVTVGHDPTEAPKEMLAPGEAPATEEDAAAAAPVTADSAVDNASEELSEGAGEAKAAMNAADEATEGALAIASESESEDVTKMAEEVALTTGEVSKVASEVLQATGEAKEALQSVATVVEEDAVAEITGDAVSSALTEQEAEKVAEVAEKLNDAAVVAEDAADQAQAAAQEAEQLVDRAEAEGDAATAKQAEDAKNYALAAQAEAEAVAETATREASALAVASEKVKAKSRKGKRRGARQLRAGDGTRWLSSHFRAFPPTACADEIADAQHRFLTNAPASRLTWLGVKKNTEQVALALALGVLAPSLPLDARGASLVLLDAGANVGQTLEFYGGAVRELARRLPHLRTPEMRNKIHVVSYEANPASYAKLEEARDGVRSSLRAYGVRADVRALRAAVGKASKGSVELHTDGSAFDQGASKYGNKRKDCAMLGRSQKAQRCRQRSSHASSSFEAPAVSLDEELVRMGVIDSRGRTIGKERVPVVAKLDVEGMESEALEGMGRGLASGAYAAVVFEYDAARTSPLGGPPALPSITARLAGMGMRCYVASASRAFLRADVPGAWPGFEEGSGPAGKGKAVNVLCAPAGGVVDAYVESHYLLCAAVGGGGGGQQQQQGGVVGAATRGGGGGGSCGRCWREKKKVPIRAAQWNTYGAVDDVFEGVESDQRGGLRARGWPVGGGGGGVGGVGAAAAAAA